MSHKSKSQIIDSRRKLRPAATVCVCVCVCDTESLWFVYVCKFMCLCVRMYLCVYAHVSNGECVLVCVSVCKRESVCVCVRILRICVRSRVQEREKI